MTYRTASYADAQRSAKLQGDEGVASTYRGATSKSQAFFRKMDDSHSEAERLRQQCRTAANASAARNNEQKVELGHIKKTIEQAKAVSSFAQGATTNDASSKMDKFNTAGTDPRHSVLASLHLGHLADPKLFEQKQQPPKAPPASLPGLPDATPRSEANLPGAVGPYQSNNDYSKQITEALGNSGDVSSPKNKDSDASKSPSNRQQSGDSNSGQMVYDAQPAATLSAPPGANEDQNSDPGKSGFGMSESDGEPLPDDSDDGSDTDYDESEASDAWPPPPPVLRFKMRMQFSDKFKPTAQAEAAEAEFKMIKDHNADLDERFIEMRKRQIEHPIVLWLNERFCMSIQTEYQFEVGFPVIVLTMMDAIYPKRVRWREVDWRFQYKRAMMKNFAVIEHIWSEVNMEKAREFRMENTPVRLETMPTSSVDEKFEFLRLMKRWYDQRIHASGPYDPMAKRRELLDMCQTSGHEVKFPPWMKFDKEYQVEISEHDAMEQKKAQEYRKMPEYKRLIHFLGCQEYQSM